MWEVMEGFCGKDLATIVRYARQLAECLAEVHSLHIVHGDVKPANIVSCHSKDPPRTTERQLALIDFEDPDPNLILILTRTRTQST